jgi:hypothetical protein
MKFAKRLQRKNEVPGDGSSDPEATDESLDLETPAAEDPAQL